MDTSAVITLGGVQVPTLGERALLAMIIINMMVVKLLLLEQEQDQEKEREGDLE
jgi:hypothetical protein